MWLDNFVIFASIYSGYTDFIKKQVGLLDNHKSWVVLSVLESLMMT